MSRWDDLYSARQALSCKRGLRSNSMNYTLFFPSDSKRIWRMIMFDEKHIWTQQDFYDLSCFVEDYVLYKYIGVPEYLSSTLGPHLIDYYKRYDQCPMFDFRNQLKDAYYNNRPTAAKNDISLNDDFIDTIYAIENDQQVHNFSISKEPKHAKIMSEFSEGLFEIIINTVKESSDVKQDDVDSIKNIVNKCTDKLAKKQYSDEEFKCYFSSWMYEIGASFTPGHFFKEWFTDIQYKSSMSHKLYKEINDIHHDKHNLIKKWTDENHIYVPPILTILIDRCSSKQDFLENLVFLREEFSDARKKTEEYNHAILQASTMQEKLELIWELEKTREKIEKSIKTKPYKSIIRRTWDIVKTGSFFKAAVKFADIALEWDDNRTLVGGLRHFSRLEKKALRTPDVYKKINRLFGDIKQ